MKKEQVIGNQGGVRRAKDAMEWIMKTLFMICGFIAIAFVLLITVYLIISGLPAIKEVGLIDFLFGTRWASTDKTDPAYGILPFILTSIYGTAGAIIIGVPIGFMTAVFLAKVAPPKVASVIRPAVDLLAGIPSVVYGLVGYDDPAARHPGVLPYSRRRQPAGCYRCVGCYDPALYHLGV